MSQYPYHPSPFIPGYYNPMPAGNFALSKARSAGIWQIVLAALMILFGALMTVIVWGQSPDVLLDAMRQQGAQVQIPEVPGWTAGELVRFAVTFLATGAAIVGLTLLVLAFFVRGGNRAAMIISCVVLGALLMFMGIGAIGGMSNPASGIGAVIMLSVPIGLSVVIMTKLIAVLRLPAVGISPTQQQAYWMMIQQQQLQHPQQYGYGYGANPAPPESGNPPMPPILPGMPQQTVPQNPPPNQPRQ